MHLAEMNAGFNPSRPPALMVAALFTIYTHIFRSEFLQGGVKFITLVMTPNRMPQARKDHPLSDRHIILWSAVVIAGNTLRAS